MNKQKLLYSINVLDVASVSREINVRFEDIDLNFIEDKIGNFFGSQWYDAVEYALRELQSRKKANIT